MLEKIRTFFGRIVGQHEKKRTVVVEGTAWRCIKCHLIFLTKEAADRHECMVVL